MPPRASPAGCPATGSLRPGATHSAAAAAEWVRREHTISAYLSVLAQAMHVHEQRFVGQRAVIDITDRLAEAGVLQVEGVVDACVDALDSFEGPKRSPRPQSDIRLSPNLPVAYCGQADPN